MLLLLAIALLSAAEGNLLKNPGFEDQAGGKPTAWEAFVSPAEGASAAAEESAHEGQWAAALHTTTPYPREPYNNWSQNFFGPFPEGACQLTAFVKTEGNAEALVLVQAWKRSPAQVLAVASTAEQQPVRGTQDWTEVKAALTVPRGTDYLTIRCVMKGTGSAWFDDLQLTGAAIEEKPGTAKQEPAAKPAEIKPAAPSLPDLNTLQNQLKDMQRSNLELLNTVRGMREENSGLQDELKSLRNQLEEMRELLKQAPPPDTPEAPKPEPPAAPVKAPPALVPHGEDPAQYK